MHSEAAPRPRKHQGPRAPQSLHVPATPHQQVEEQSQNLANDVVPTNVPPLMHTDAARCPISPSFRATDAGLDVNGQLRGSPNNNVQDQSQNVANEVMHALSWLLTPPRCTLMLMLNHKYLITLQLKHILKRE